MNEDMDKSWKPDPETGLPTLDQHREEVQKTMTQTGFALPVPKPESLPVEVPQVAIVDELDE